MAKKFKPKTLHLEEEGVSKVLGQLESKVMKLIWEKGRSTVREIRDALALVHKELSFNSIMTIMNRLTEKGLLNKRKQQQVYRYQATVSESEFKSNIAEKILSSLLSDQSLLSAAHFADFNEKLDPQALKKLKQLLK